jgi:putative ATP-dependent endonuclease of the OLD family
MRLSRLVVDNFRSIEHLDIELPQIGALIGPNNAGKSNLLLAIQRILGRDWVRVADFEAEDVYGGDSGKDVRIAVTFDPPLGYQKFKGSPVASISTLSFEYTRYKIGPQKGQRRLEQACLDAAGNPVRFSRRHRRRVRSTSISC